LTGKDEILYVYFTAGLDKLLKFSMILGDLDEVDDLERRF